MSKINPGYDVLQHSDITYLETDISLFLLR